MTKVISSFEPILSVPKWYEFHKRSRSPFFSNVIFTGPSIQKKGFPFDHRIKNFGIFCGHVAIDIQEMDALRDKTLAQLRKEPEFLLRFMESAYLEHTQAVTRWKAANKRDFSALSTEDFARVFKAYVTDLLSFGVYVTLPLFVESYLESFLDTEFEKRFGDSKNEWLAVAFNPIKTGSVLQEEISRLRLVAEEKNIMEGLVAQARTFGWMANVGFFETYYDVEYYRALLENPMRAKQKLSEIEKNSTEHKKRFETLLTRIADNSYLTAIAKTANEAVFFRSYRTEILYSSSFYNQALLHEAARRLSLADYTDVVWLYGDEIVQALREYSNVLKNIRIDMSRIANRKNTYAFLSDFDGKYYSWDSADAKALCAIYEKKQDNEPHARKIKGMCAFAGKVKGRVVVLKDATEVQKVHGGEVLVTHATNVNFVPILKKVSAIITEEGGILSHASIISRELRIPCIIGTKIATKVLKDGDIVEVDANAGIVKILKRAT